MIICPKCGKENQDHYKFCLGCGAEIPRDAAAAKAAPPTNTPPHGTAGVVADPFAGAPAPKAPSAPPPAAAKAPCPQCGTENPPGMKFCMGCGFNLASAGAPPAPAVAPPPASVAQSVPAAQPVSQGPICTLTALRADKSEVGSYTMQASGVVGRDTGSIFAGDSYLSPRHASFTKRGTKLFVKDENSLNGTFVKLAAEVAVEIRAGDVFRIGQEIVRFEPLAPQPASPDGVERLGSPSKGYVGRIALVIGRDVTGNAFPIPEAGVHLGRERGDILFPEDGYVSGLHCRIKPEGGKIFLTDLGSSNGTFLRISTERELVGGDEILMGQQLFRIATH